MAGRLRVLQPYIIGSMVALVCPDTHLVHIGKESETGHPCCAARGLVLYFRVQIMDLDAASGPPDHRVPYSSPQLPTSQGPTEWAHFPFGAMHCDILERQSTFY